MVTVPRTSSPSQATAVSGSVLVIRISPNSPRWRASDSGSLSSAHSSGGDFTRVRFAWTSDIDHPIRPCPRDPFRLLGPGGAM